VSRSTVRSVSVPPSIGVAAALALCAYAASIPQTIIQTSLPRLQTQIVVATQDGRAFGIYFGAEIRFLSQQALRQESAMGGRQLVVHRLRFP
jgi:hypothetical protein